MNVSSRFRFGAPASAIPAKCDVRACETVLGSALGMRVEMCIFHSYDELARSVSNGAVDAAWAPPFVSARLEVMGITIVARAIRKGASTYRAALVVRSDASISIESLRGTVAAWTDPNSVAGYLLPMAWFKAQGRDPGVLFHRQEFVGSYRAGLEAVALGRAAVTSVFSAASSEAPTALSTVWPEEAHAFKVLGFSTEAPNDGIAAAPSLTSIRREQLRAAFTSLTKSDSGAELLRTCFHADRFEVAPPLGYRSLYRLADRTETG